MKGKAKRRKPIDKETRVYAVSMDMPKVGARWTTTHASTTELVSGLRLATATGEAPIRFSKSGGFLVEALPVQICRDCPWPAIGMEIDGKTGEKIVLCRTHMEARVGQANPFEAIWRVA